MCRKLACPPAYYHLHAGVQIESAELAEGEFLLGIKALAATRSVAAGTAHRAVKMLVESDHVKVVAGRGARVSRARHGGTTDRLIKASPPLGIPVTTGPNSSSAELQSF